MQKELTSNDLKADIAAMEEKYGVSPDDRIVQTFLERFLYRYTEEHNNLQLADEDKNYCLTHFTCYSEISKYLDKKYKDSRVVRIDQLAARELHISLEDLLKPKEAKYFSWSNIKEMGLSMKELETKLREKLAKNLILHTGNFESYSNHFPEALVEFFNLFFGTTAKWSYTTRGIAEYQDKLNSLLAGVATVTLYKNGKAVITFQEKERHEEAMNFFLKKALDRYKGFLND